jgi:hypothetical protein
MAVKPRLKKVGKDLLALAAKLDEPKSRAKKNRHRPRS